MAKKHEEVYCPLDIERDWDWREFPDDRPREHIEELAFRIGTVFRVAKESPEVPDAWT
jgi:hypothetical protein